MTAEIRLVTGEQYAQLLVLYLFHVIENVQQGVVTPCINCFTLVWSCALSTVDTDSVSPNHRVIIATLIDVITPT